MTSGFVGDLTVFILALLVGFEVISKVPATLHTPLMSGANSIHGVVLVGVVLLSSFVDGPVGYLLTFVAAAFAAANVVGGYVVTDRMLRMFRRRPVPPPRVDAAMEPAVESAVPTEPPTGPGAAA
ncbi:MAG: proton-translocating transhydrogenase family protein [bacterium]